MLEIKRKSDKYKTELKEFIANKERQQAEQKNIKSEKERMERKRADSEIAAQLLKERRLLEKKRESKRLVAIEAMQIAEQRRIREKQINSLKNQVATLFAEESVINQIKQRNEQQIKNAKEEFQRKTFATALADIKNVQNQENESMLRTVNEFQAKLKFKDQAKVDERRKIKEMQIKSHLEDVARQNKIKELKKFDQQRDIENRIRNEKVNVEFDRQKRLETVNRVKEHRKIIMEQIEERQRVDREKDFSDLISLHEMNVKEDNAFFNYAHELINETKQKGRSVYPFVKVVKEYKRSNNLNDRSQKEDNLIYNVDQLRAMRTFK